jgi:hypothetical protein
MSIEGHVTETPGRQTSVSSHEPKNFTETEKEHQANERLMGQVQLVWQKVGKFISIGFLIGVTLVVMGDLGGKHLPEIIHEDIMRNDVIEFSLILSCLIIKDLGLGLIVAAIAVFGYEFLTHISGFVNEADRLKGGYYSLDAATTQLKSAIRNSNPREAFRQDIHILFPERELREPLCELVERTLELKDKEIPKVTNEYLKFLGWFITQFALSNAEELLDLQKSIREKNQTKVFEYRSPDTHEVASRILAAHMRSLSKHDSYDSVSNVLFYEEERMFVLHAAMKDAFLRGVKVRRIFNVSNFEMDEKLRLKYPNKFEIAKKILDRHMRLVEDSEGLYEIRFFGQDIKNKGLIKTEFNPREYNHLKKLPLLYFALFNHHMIESRVLFIVEDPKLSKMELAYCEATNPSVQLFEELWGLCNGTPNPFEGDAFNPEWLREHCQKLVESRNRLQRRI